MRSFQQGVLAWMLECFGARVTEDKATRNYRFIEEALELAQACGMTKAEGAQLLDYVYGRPIGEPEQEVGGVMVTLAGVCAAQGIDMRHAAESELARVWTKIEQIRAKQATKMGTSPLPGAA